MSFSLNPRDTELLAPFDCKISIISSQEQKANGYKILIEPESHVIKKLKNLYQKKYLSDVISGIYVENFQFFEPDKEDLDQKHQKNILNLRANDDASGNTNYHNDQTNHGGDQSYRFFNFKSGEKIGCTLSSSSPVKITINSSFGFTIDPLSFWSGLITAHSINDKHQNDEKIPKIQSWLKNVGRSIIEIRDEYNEKIEAGNIYEQSFELTDFQNKNSFTGKDLIKGIAVFSNLDSEIKIYSKLDDLIISNSLNTSIKRVKSGNYASIKLNSHSNHLIIWIINPYRWFSRQKAILKDGFQPLNDYTLGNIVEPLIDGEDYFKDLYYEMQKLNSKFSSHYFHILGWWIDPLTTYLIREDKKSNLRNCLKELKKTKPPKIRAIIYDHPLWDLLHLDGGFFDWTLIMKSLGASYVRDKEKLPGVDLNRVLRSEGDHHMKIISIENIDGKIAYCGGIDFEKTRMTNPYHIKENAGFDKKPIKFHDIMLKVKGNAAFNLERIFRNRWMDHPKAEPKDFDKLIIPEDKINGIAVQTACTIPKLGYKFALNGDNTLFRTYEKAIKNAKNYIYIEDQFLSSKKIAELLRDQLDSVNFIVIVAPGPYKHLSTFENLTNLPRPKNKLLKNLFKLIGLREFNKSFMESVFWSLMYSKEDINFKDFRNIIMEHPQADKKFRVCYLENDEGKLIYPHSKIMIIDDIFVSCGSANIDSRGMGLGHAASTECNLMCIDTAITKSGKRKFAHDFRIRLWAEHFNYPININENLDEIEDTELYQLLDDPVVGYEMLWKHGNIGRIHRYN